MRAPAAELRRGRQETHGLGRKLANQKTNEKARIGKGIDTHFLGKSNKTDRLEEEMRDNRRGGLKGSDEPAGGVVRRVVSALRSFGPTVQSGRRPSEGA